MSTLTVCTDVDIDIDDIIRDIPTRELTAELQRRKADPIDTPSEKQIRTFIGQHLQLRDWQINDKASFIKAIEEKLF